MKQFKQSKFRLHRNFIEAGFRSEWMPFMLPSHWNTAWEEYLTNLFQHDWITEHQLRYLLPRPPV